MGHVLAIDQGTTSTRALLFDATRKIVAVAQRELPQIFPAPGWVEHDAELIYAHALECARSVLAQADVPAKDIAALGIANQRETIVLWDKRTGKPLANAIVWQDRRTADLCRTLREAGHEVLIAERTGLCLDPYFSATKIAWLLRENPACAAAAKAGALLCGTIDCWLIWKLTGGKRHLTDATNASRTALCNIHTGAWDPDLLRLFGVPAAALPEIRDTDGDFGATDPSLFGAAIPIRSAVGDQQAAAVAQGCLTQGTIKATYGTGCFILLNTGGKPVASKTRLLTTIALQRKGQRSYAIEGSIFIAGAVVQWLRDGLRLIKTAAEADQLVKSARADSKVYLVPAFAGLGAPYWDAEARGAIFGLTRDTGPAEIARAALESVGHQTRDLLQALATDLGEDRPRISTMRVDGGMSRSDDMLHMIADLTGCTLERPRDHEATATGAAWLAGSAAGIYPDLPKLAAGWTAEHIVHPRMAAAERDTAYAGWQDAVVRVRSR